MRFFSSSNITFKLLKCIVVFLLFVLIVAVPLIEVLANNNPPSQDSNLNETVNNVLTMLGGGGIGVAGNELVKKRNQTPSNEQMGDSSTINQSENPLYRDYIEQIKTDVMKKLAVVKKRQDSLNSKINAIEFFLGQKYDDFKRKDTLH